MNLLAGVLALSLGCQAPPASNLEQGEPQCLAEVCEFPYASPPPQIFLPQPPPYLGKYSLSRYRRAPSTVYWPGDGMSGEDVACWGVVKRKYHTTKIRQLLKLKVPVVATRGKGLPYPCGSKLLLRNPRNSKWSIGIKLDTGPWSAYNTTTGERRVMLGPLPHLWERKSFIDVTPKVALELSHLGYQNLDIWLLKEPI